jgi:putative oxidoreductase
MTDAAFTAPARLWAKVRGALDATPYSLLALIARGATFSVFFRSGLVKISDWSATLALFHDEYRVPVLPPEIAAGLFTRASVLALLGMVCVIQLFVYPMAWPDHIQWLAFMAVLLARGPGVVSLDALLGRLLNGGVCPQVQNAAS